MPKVSVTQWDAFTTRPGMDNPAGIVWDAQQWSEEQMQAIAARVGFNETVFVCPSDRADLRLRYFTPGQEMDLCGHGTVAAVSGWMSRQGETGRRSITIPIVRSAMCFPAPSMSLPLPPRSARDSPSPDGARAQIPAIMPALS